MNNNAQQPIAARAPADSVTAPAGWQTVPTTPTSDQLNAACEPFLNWQANSKNTGGPIQSLGAAMYSAMLAAAPTPPAHAEDSAPEDAALLDWLNENIFHREMSEWDEKFGGRGDQDMWVLFAPKGVQGSARNILDAARKQGANHD